MKIANYMHLKLGKGRVTATIGIELNEGGGETALVGLAFCSPEDQFCRKTGRTISEERLETGKKALEFQLSADRQVSIQVREAIISGIKSGELECPSWVIYSEALEGQAVKEVCIECDVPIEMLKPTLENPGRRFGCPKCGEVYVGIDIASEEELKVN